MLKIQTRDYKSVFEIVHDLRQIIYSAKGYLQNRPHIFLMNSMLAFEKELETILGEYIFTGYDFTHITGAPDETLTHFRQHQMNNSNF